MSNSAVDRSAFMRMMGISEDDVAEPDSAKAAPMKAAASTRSTTNSIPPRKHLATASSMSSAGLTCSELGGSTNTNTESKRRAFLAEMGLDENMHASHSAAQPTWSDEVPTRSAGLSGSVKFTMPSSGGGGGAKAQPRKSGPEQLKADGNAAFEAGKFAEAIRCYSAAIDTTQNSYSPFDEFAPQVDTVLLAALFSNRSASYLQGAKTVGGSPENAYDHALFDADQAVATRPSWFKGYSRQGDAHFKLQHYVQAAEAYEMALHLEPGNASVSRALAESKERAKQDSQEKWQARRQARKMAHSKNSLNNSLTSSQPLAPPARSNLTRSNQAAAASAALREGTAPSGNSRAMWNQLKTEVEQTANAPTGDDYRRQQLEKYRVQKESRSSTYSSGSHEASGASSSRANLANTSSSYSSVRGKRDIPEEFSSDAASAYQQQLLEKYRQKRSGGRS